MRKDRTIRPHRLKLIFFGLFLFAVMALIFYMSAQNADDSSLMSRSVYSSWIGQILDRILPRLLSQNGENSLRKYAHLFEFFLLGLSSFLFAYELFWLKESRLGKTMAVSFLWSVLYSCSDEWHQTFISGRSGQFRDVCLDSLGIAGGILMMSLVVFVVHMRRKHA